MCVQLLSHVQLLVIPGTAACQASLGFAQTHVYWVSDAIQPSPLLLSSFPTALNLSQHQRLFQWVSPSHQMDKVFELQLQHQSFQWILGLTSFKTDCFDFLAVQGTLKSSPAPQFESISSSVLSFMVQLSHPYRSNKKNIALTIWIFGSKLVSLLFTMLSCPAFLPKSKCFLTSWLQDHLQWFWSTRK